MVGLKDDQAACHSAAGGIDEQSEFTSLTPFSFCGGAVRPQERNNLSAFHEITVAYWSQHGLIPFSFLSKVRPFPIHFHDFLDPDPVVAGMFIA